MASDPTDQLLTAMAGFGLDPKTIIWDGRTHRFPGSGKKRGDDAGWYLAYPDRKGAHFGDWSTGLKQHWICDRAGPPSDFERRKWAKEKEKRDREQAEAYAAARGQALKVWKGSRTPDLKDPHAYLFNKGIEESPGVRISNHMYIGPKENNWQVPRGLLIIPMRIDGRIVNVQRIWPNGKKRPWPGAEVIGARHLIGDIPGPGEPMPLVYICEGWATGYWIWKATGALVVVAFTAGNLLPVARNLKRKRDPERIIIAADNDRWKSFRLSDGEKVNPGVYWANVAAEEIGAEVAIPDFKDLEGKPTDFDDLRMREGLDAVRKWLDPEMAEKARTRDEEDVAVKPAGDDAEEAEEPKPWAKTAPFRPLGHDLGIYTFASGNSGQVRTFRGLDLRRTDTLYGLADKKWWKRNFPLGSKPYIDIEEVLNQMIKACHRKGVFHPDRYVGRGASRTEEGEYVLHLGDQLLAPGASDYCTPEHFENGDRIYPRLARIVGPGREKPMTAEEAGEVLALFESLPWEDEWAATLAAGWLAVAPHCGALDDRPHIWINGDTDSGKSTLLKRIISVLLRCIDPVYTEATITTEPGIRQALRGDARPVILDECDISTRKTRNNLHNIFDLARSATSGGYGTKGSSDGTAVTYTIRSMFLFASINVGLKLTQDKNRVAVLTLQNPKQADATKRREGWVQLQQDIARIVSPAAGQRLMARTTAWFRDGRFDELLSVCNAAAYSVLETSRAGNVYGVLLAGAYMLKGDDVPTFDEVTAWIKDSGLGISQAERQATEHGTQAIDLLLQTKEMILQHGYKEMVPVGRLVEIVATAPDKKAKVSGIKVEDADYVLRHNGLRVIEGQLVIANRSKWAAGIFKNTQFEGGWRDTLRRLPGAEPWGNNRQVRFYPGFKDRVTGIKLASLDIEQQTTF